MRRFVPRICTAPRTSLSASRATSTSVTTRRVHGANRPEQTVPVPWALDRSSSSMRTEAAVAQDSKSARVLASSWLPCVRGTSGWSSPSKRHAWRGTTVTGTICSISVP